MYLQQIFTTSGSPQYRESSRSPPAEKYPWQEAFICCRQITDANHKGVDIMKKFALMLMLWFFASTGFATAGEIHQHVVVPNLEKIQKILDKDPTRLNARDSHGYTPLMLSASVGNLTLTRFFISRGALLDLSNIHGNTALHVATIMDSGPVVESLLEAGASMDDKNGDGNTPLHLAASHGSNESVKLLIKFGASKDIMNNNGKTPRDLARDEGFTKILDMLDNPPSPTNPEGKE